MTALPERRTRARNASATAGRTAVLINAQSGTVRSIGVEAMRNILEGELTKWPQKPEFSIIDGSEIDTAVKGLVTTGGVSTIIAGGGDGTIASIARHLTGTDIALGILPLGTMNLMAKSLDISPDVSGALAELGRANSRLIDVGRVEDQIFLHHLSLGIQPRMVRIREKLGYSTRLTKMLAGLRAMFSVVMNPQSLRLKAIIDGHTVELKSPALVISNNLYADSTWMKHRSLEEGLLGIYAVKPMSWLAFVKLALDMFRGRWRDNLNVLEDSAKHVIIEKRRRFGGKSRAILCTLDGEVTLLSTPLEVRINPLALKVLTPLVTGPDTP